MFARSLVWFKVIYAKVGALRGAMLKTGGGGVNNTVPRAGALPCLQGTRARSSRRLRCSFMFSLTSCWWGRSQHLLPLPQDRVAID